LPSEAREEKLSCRKGTGSKQRVRHQKARTGARNRMDQRDQGPPDMGFDHPKTKLGKRE
jgi:hypothetical protein